MGLIGVSGALLLVQLQSQPRLLRNLYPAVAVYERLIGDLFSVIYITIHDLQNTEIRGTCRKLECCGIGDRAAGVMPVSYRHLSFDTGVTFARSCLPTSAAAQV